MVILRATIQTKMSKKLIALVFKKAEEEIGPSKKTQRAQHISDVLLEDYKYQISERRLRDYYTNYVEKEKKSNEALRPQLIEPLCKYLGYDNYASFVVDHPSEKEGRSFEKELRVGVLGKNKNALIVTVSAIALSCLTYFGFVNEEQNCMIWKQDHFEQTVCSGVPLERPYDELTLNEFRRISYKDSLIERKANKKELWYDKSNGQVEFFTYHGFHPENDKPLKNVTDYIFKTYVLDKMNDSLTTKP